MKKKILITSLLIAMFMSGLLITPASAMGQGERLCYQGVVGGGFAIWDPEFHTCTYYDPLADQTCGKGRGESYVWVFGSGFAFIGCVGPIGSGDVTAGSPIDAWSGNCGIYIAAPPFAGTVTIQKISQGHNSVPYHRGLRFISHVCRVSYNDLSGNPINGYGSVATVYFNLTNYTYDRYYKGFLDLYVYENGSWAACPNTMFLEGGNFGRLACVTTAAVFGIAE